MSKIKTRILLISDTHATIPHPPPFPNEFETADLVRVVTGFRYPLPSADIVLHCGDLTKRSTVVEYETTFSLLRSLDAPLKLVIAGNHDLLLDATYDHHHAGSRAEEDAQAVRKIIQDAETHDGVRYLTEGSYEFTLQNGAAIKVYASQYTPVYGGWAFQYAGAHDFAIPPGVDVVMTHGPPYGILDEAGLSTSWSQPDHAGCDYLFKAVAAARPRIHCFGHIHEAWGAYLGTWLDKDSPGFSAPLLSKEDVMDETKSRVLQTLDGLRPVFAADTTGRSPEARQKLAHLSEQRGYHIDLTDEQTRVEQGKQTLFVNAAIMDIRYRPSQLPWIVDLHLPRAGQGQEPQDHV